MEVFRDVITDSFDKSHGSKPCQLSSTLAASRVGKEGLVKFEIY